MFLLMSDTTFQWYGTIYYGKGMIDTSSKAIFSELEGYSDLSAICLSTSPKCTRYLLLFKIV